MLLQAPSAALDDSGRSGKAEEEQQQEKANKNPTSTTRTSRIKEPSFACAALTPAKIVA